MKNKKLLTRILATAFALFVGYNAFAAHIIVAPSVTYIDGSTSPYNTLLPGDTLLFQGGARSYIQIRNFTGTLALPIIIRTGLGHKSECRFMLKDGSTRIIESNRTVVKENDGNISKLIVVSA